MDVNLRRAMRLVGSLLVLTGAREAVAEAPSAGDPPPEDVQVLSVLLNTPVEVAAKWTKQRLADAPAIVSVITGEEIRELGYRSVAEALQSVPGLYAVDDFLAPNLGVRGISGGLRGYSRIVKVMINGQPVSFRPDTTNFIGPELVPMEAVARIEVVRGPASSLYGANAFLGVVNIVTRKVEGPTGGSLLLRARAPQGDHGSEAVLGAERDQWRWMVAVSAADDDRSGYRLSASSPLLITNPELASRASRNDLSRSRSALLEGQYQATDDITMGLLGHFSRLDSYAEFLDFGTLSHRNRVVLDNGFLRLKGEARFSESFGLTASLAYAAGGPSGREHLDAGDAATHPRRDVGYAGWDAMVEARYLARERDSLVLGFDHSTEMQQLMTVYTVNDATGFETVAGDLQGHKNFANTGIYAQAIHYPVRWLGLTGNIRMDHHNIYRRKTTYRIGLVADLQQGLYAKLLMGTSFKAPGAVQLYAQPLFGGEVLGNPSLRPESARTVEAELGWSQGDWIALSVNAFQNRVKEKVELIPAGLNQVPANLGLQDSHGVEGTAQVALGGHRVTSSVAWQQTDAHTPDPFRGERVSPTAMYPSLWAYFRWQYRFRPGQSLGFALRYASERRATDSNIREHVIYAYALPAYTLVDAFWSHGWRKEGMGRFRLQVAVRNLLDRRYAESGFLGVDVPGRRREVCLNFGCQF